jgi:hypothetical protein
VAEISPFDGLAASKQYRQSAEIRAAPEPDLTHGQQEEQKVSQAKHGTTNDAQVQSHRDSQQLNGFDYY